MPRSLAAVLASIILCSTVAPHVFGQETTQREAALKLLPPQALLFLQAPAPSRLVDFVMEHPLRPQVESMPVYQTAMNSDQYRQFLGGLALVQSQLGKTWRDALDSLVGGGVYFAFDPKTESACLLARTKDLAFAKRTRDQLVNWGKFAKQPVTTSDYEGVQIVQGRDGGAVAVWGDWIAVSNKPDALHQIIDREKTGGESLADHARLRAALPTSNDALQLWSFVDLKQLRDAGQAKELFVGQADNPGAEIFFGGVLAALQHTDHLTASLKTKGPYVRLTATTPYQHQWAEGPREHFFGPDGKGRAKQLVKDEESIFSIAAYRDIARMWMQADDLFSPEMVDSLAEADSNLTTFFGGRDFGEDILGSLKPQVQFLVSRQSFPTLPRPALKLPGFTLVGTLKDPEPMKRDLKRTFQSLIGFLNIVGAMEGNPQFDMDSETVGEAKIYTASYVAEPEEAKSESARIFFNFSPCIAFRGDRVVISSSIEVAKRLINAEAGAETAANTQAVLRGEAARSALNDNRNQLIAQNMLEEGHTRAEAETEIGALLDIASLIRSLELKLTATKQLTFELTATTAK